MRPIEEIPRLPLASEAGGVPQKHTNQTGSQQNPQPVGNRFNHRRGFGRRMQRLRNLRQDLGSPALLTGDLGETAGFQKLPNCPARIVALAARSSLKKSGSLQWINVAAPMVFIADHQRSCHHRPGAILGRQQIAGRIQLVLADRPALLKSLDGHCALSGLETGTPESAAIAPSASAPISSSEETRCQK